MRIFALETDLEKLTRSFVPEEHALVRRVHHHWLIFFLKSLKSSLISMVFIAIAVAMWLFVGFPGLYAAGGVLLLLLLFVFFPLMRAFIDWKYDVLIVTKDKIVVVDQSSLFRREVREMNLENVAAISTETQYWNIFPFGKIVVDLKEGHGNRLILPFMPQADDISTAISDVLVQYERRKEQREK